MSKVDLIFAESEKAFHSERDRAEKLGKGAEKLIGAVGVIVGFQLVTLDHLTFGGDWLEALYSTLTVIAFILFGGSLMLTFWSMRVQKYYSYPRGTTLIDQLKGEDISEQAAKVKIAKMYLAAYNKNAKINDLRAKLLLVSLVFLVAGFVTAVTSFALDKVV